MGKVVRETMLKKVNEIFGDVFNDDSIIIDEKTSAMDIEDWDSLTHITLINNVEKIFGITFTLDEVLDMRNVGEMLDVITMRLKEIIKYE